eukprot:540512_1
MAHCFSYSLVNSSCVYGDICVTILTNKQSMYTVEEKYPNKQIPDTTNALNQTSTKSQLDSNQAMLLQQSGETQIPLRPPVPKPNTTSNYGINELNNILLHGIDKQNETEQEESEFAGEEQDEVEPEQVEQLNAIEQQELNDEEQEQNETTHKNSRKLMWEWIIMFAAFVCLCIAWIADAPIASSFGTEKGVQLWSHAQHRALSNIKMYWYFDRVQWRDSPSTIVYYHEMGGSNSGTISRFEFMCYWGTLISMVTLGIGSALTTLRFCCKSSIRKFKYVEMFGFYFFGEHSAGLVLVMVGTMMVIVATIYLSAQLLTVGAIARDDHDAGKGRWQFEFTGWANIAGYGLMLLLEMFHIA